MFNIVISTLVFQVVHKCLLQVIFVLRASHQGVYENVVLLFPAGISVWKKLLGWWSIHLRLFLSVTPRTVKRPGSPAVTYSKRLKSAQTPKKTQTSASMDTLQVFPSVSVRLLMSALQADRPGPPDLQPRKLWKVIKCHAASVCNFHLTQSNHRGTQPCILTKPAAPVKHSIGLILQHQLYVAIFFNLFMCSILAKDSC